MGFPGQFAAELNGFNPQTDANPQARLLDWWEVFGLCNIRSSPTAKFGAETVSCTGMIRA